MTKSLSPTHCRFTGVCRSDLVLEELTKAHPAFVQKCEDTGVKYTIYMGDADSTGSGVGRSWKSYFSASDRESCTSNVHFPKGLSLFSLFSVPPPDLLIAVLVCACVCVVRVWGDGILLTCGCLAVRAICLGYRAASPYRFRRGPDEGPRVHVGLAGARSVESHDAAARGNRVRPGHKD